MNSEQAISVGDRIRVQLYKITGYVPDIDEDDGLPYQRVVSRKNGSEWATVTATGVMGGEFVAAKFDKPIPNINDESHTSDVWSVHPVDIVEHVRKEELGL